MIAHIWVHEYDPLELLEQHSQQRHFIQNAAWDWHPFFRILMEKNRLKWHELNHFLGNIFFSISLFNNWVSCGFYYSGAIYYFGKLNIFFPEQTLMLEMLLIVIAPLILLCTIYIWNAGTNCTFVFFKIH